MRGQPVKLLFAGLAALALSGCALLSGDFGDVPAARQVDLARYMGDWRVIANIPYYGEEGCIDSVESYALLPNGKIDNWFSCRKGSADAPLESVISATAQVIDDNPAHWIVSFFGVLRIKYVILAVDDDYQWAAVAHPSRQYGWVFARGNTLPDDTYQHVLSLFAAQGYDTARFAKVPQPTAQLAHPRP